MRTIFFGTPEFAVPSLAAMVDAGYAPRAVITRPPRPVGRGHRLQQPPVAVWARDHDLAVLQPIAVNRRRFRERLEALAPDVAVVAAFGQIFRRRLLDLPRLGCINLHASLLPRYRGAAPVQAAIAAGDAVTGVTTMRMTEGLDSGPMLLREEVEIGPAETTPELTARLARRGARLVVDTLRRLERGELTGEPQPEDLASYAPQLDKSDGIVDWRRTADEIYNRIRAYTPWPGQSSTLRGKRVKLVRVRPLEGRASGEPGTLAGLADGLLKVVCGKGTVLGLERVQVAGRHAVNAADFANGERLQGGERFG